MVQVDIPFSFGVGALMATAVEKGLRSERRSYFYLRGLSANLIFQVLFALWLPVYLLVSHFGFQTSHMWWHGDSLTDYPTMLPVFVVAYFVSSLSGYHFGASLVVRNRTRTAWAIFIASCAFFIGWIALQPYRTLRLGTYREWIDGRAAWAWSDGRFMALLGAAFVIIVGAMWMFYVAIQREANEAARQAARQA